MFVLTYYNSWSGGYTYGQYNNLGDKQFNVGILDTDTLEEYNVTRQELEKAVADYPNSQIEGVKTYNGKVTQIYIDKRTDVLIEGKYALVARYFTARGNFCRCYLYKKGIGLIYKWETPHYTHYDWNFELDVKGSIITITESIDRPRYDINFEMKLQDIQDKIKVLYMPTQAEVDRY